MRQIPLIVSLVIAVLIGGGGWYAWVTLKRIETSLPLLTLAQQRGYSGLIQSLVQLLGNVDAVTNDPNRLRVSELAVSLDLAFATKETFYSTITEQTNPTVVDSGNELERIFSTLDELLSNPSALRDTRLLPLHTRLNDVITTFRNIYLRSNEDVLNTLGTQINQIETLRLNTLVMLFLIGLSLAGMGGLAYTQKRTIALLEATERELRSTQASLTNAQRMAELGSWDWDIVADQTRWSAEASRIFNRADGDPDQLGVVLRSTVHPDDINAVEKALNKSMKSGLQFTVNHRIPLSNGENRYVHLQGEIAVDGPGKPRLISGTVHDISERVAIEKKLLEARHSAESANRAKSSFLANMSHELRTPLNSILGFTGIILSEMAGPLTDEQKKQLSMVKGSATHLLNLIRDVLDISKIEAGELEVVIESFDMRIMVEEVVETLAPLANEKGLKLISSISPDVGLISSDERRIRQILINLVNNAVKFSDQGQIKIICRQVDSQIETEVVDTGIGIAKTDQAKLFRPFIQLESGTARKYEGTGLGLSICKHILHMLGGNIQVTSCPGEGSTFSFYLPIALDMDHTETKDAAM